MVKKNSLDLSESSRVQLDIKTLIGIVGVILSIAGVYFTLQGQLAQLQTRRHMFLDATGGKAKIMFNLNVNQDRA